MKERRTFPSARLAFPRSVDYAAAVQVYPRLTIARRLWRFFFATPWRFD